MIKGFGIKKELTEEEFKDIVIVCERDFNEVTDITKAVLSCEIKAKSITPAEEVFILLFNSDTKEFEIPTHDKTVPFNIKQDSILSECYKSKQALFVNDITRSLIYNKKIDNFLNLNLKNLLLIPILDDSNERNILAIMWMAILSDSWNQYTQKDLEYMTRFSIFIKRFLHENSLVDDDCVDDTNFLDGIESYDKLNAQRHKEQEYFSSIIHDIRTPMNGVMGFLELLNLREEEMDKKEYIDIALKSCENMVSLINDALDISKISSGNMSVEKISFSVLDELSDVANLFYNNAKRKDITLVAFYDPKIPKTIQSDYHRIKQIMNNLLSNAIKFTSEKGKIVLEILYDKERDGLTISIKDNGIGIAKEMQKNIFSPYAQEKNSTSREYGGTGLGLSIAQQLSVLLGGKLELESKEGEGSRFFFTIPCATKKGTPPSISIQKLKDLSVMVYCPIEHSSVMHSTKCYLEEFGLDIVEVNNNKALESAVKKKFDILVVSIDYTISDQEEVQKILKKGKPVIIVGTGYLNEGYHLFVGDVRRINGPILPHDLYNIIIELINTEDKKNKDKMLTVDIKKTKDKQILIVDDNIVNLRFMSEVLKTMDIKAVLTQSGKESIERFKSEKFDMIFMDQNMPNMQGTEAISLIRKIENKNKTKAIPILGLTGNADKKTKEKMLSGGANEVLTKPIHIKDIIDIVIKYL